MRSVHVAAVCLLVVPFAGALPPGDGNPDHLVDYSKNLWSQNISDFYESIVACIAEFNESEVTATFHEGMLKVKGPGLNARGDTSFMLPGAGPGGKTVDAMPFGLPMVVPGTWEFVSQGSNGFVDCLTMQSI